MFVPSPRDRGCSLLISVSYIACMYARCCRVCRVNVGGGVPAGWLERCDVSKLDIFDVGCAWGGTHLWGTGRPT